MKHHFPLAFPPPNPSSHTPIPSKINGIFLLGYYCDIQMQIQKYINNNLPSVFLLFMFI